MGTSQKGATLTLGGLAAVGALLFTIWHTQREDDEKQASAVAASNSCKIAGHLYDLRPSEGRYQPLALNIQITNSKNVLRVNMISAPDGRFSWKGNCEDLDQAPIRVSLGQGYCVAPTGHAVNSHDNIDQNIYVNPSLLEYRGPGACPPRNDPSDQE